MDNKVLRMGVVGCGFFGQKHADIINQIPNARLVAVCDIQEDAARNAGRMFGVNNYTSCQEMLDKEQIDAVSICVSEDFHLEPALCAAKNGKHILLEKPIARNAVEAEQIKQAALENNVRLMVAHVCEFDGRYRYTADAIERGELGEIISIYLKRSSTQSTAARLKGKVSMFHYMGVHDFEAMLLFARPALPVKAYSQWVAKKNAFFNAQDTSFSVITFDNGIVGCIQLCWALPDNEALAFVACAEVVGTKGVSYIDVKNQGLEIFSETGLRYPDLTYWPEYFGHTAGKVREEIQHFVDATLSGQPYLVDTDLAIEAVRTIDACFKSLETGQPVTIER
ncbi:MAG TPA: Gfo/Idh/MocA family oxidoreductase [Bacillota bacterium]|nr:Gfo/Idh/MocA family oxidoreductase [Bacillota bacterium]